MSSPIKSAELLVRIDERVHSLTTRIENEISPAIKQLALLIETVKWLKLATLGIYTGIGAMVLQSVVNAYFR